MSKKKTYNAAEEADVYGKDEEVDSKRRDELNDIKTILKMPAGIRFFRRFMEKGMIFQTTFTGNRQSHFLEGHRNLALMFLFDIKEVAPEVIPELMTGDEKDE